MKKKIKEKDVKEIKSNVRKRSGRYQKCKGNSYERQIARELRELGFEGIKTSRSESKSTDDNKIDLIDINGILPLGIQLKKTKATPSYFTIREQTT
jgi:Holliday junction resolvase